MATIPMKATLRPRKLHIGTPINAFEVVADKDFRMEKNLYPVNLLQALPMLRDNGIFLCGGSALALYLGHTINTIKDYDFYCKNGSSQKWFENYLTIDMGMELQHVSNNALTFKPKFGAMQSSVQIIIRKHYTDYQAVFEDFDFSICKVGYLGNYEYCFGLNTQQHILEKKLVLEGKITDDFAKRWFKYDLKGFKMPRSQVAEILKTAPNISFDSRMDLGY